MMSETIVQVMKSAFSILCVSHSYMNACRECVKCYFFIKHGVVVPQ